jgi:hypothetical protein
LLIEDTCSAISILCSRAKAEHNCVHRLKGSEETKR